MQELLRPVVRHKTVLELGAGRGLIAKNGGSYQGDGRPAGDDCGGGAGQPLRKLRFFVQDMFCLPYTEWHV